MIPKYRITPLRSLIIRTLFLVSFLFAGSAANASEKVIVYNWSDYLPKGVLEKFTKETGIEVEYSTYDSNNVMYRRLKVLRGRGYDVVVPSTSLVERMRQEGLIQAIQKDRLENLVHMNPALLDKEYDPGNRFSVPYLWGSTGIAINRNKFKDTKISSWRDLWSFRWKDSLLVADDMRDIFSIALMVNGHSVNTTDGDELDAAYDRLRRLKDNIKSFSGNQTNDFAKSQANIGISWSGDIALAQTKQPEIEYIYPEEGVNVWVDSFVIPARAKNVDNAHRFIDFMLRPEIAALCTAELKYATPNLSGQGQLEDSIRNNPTIFPPQEILERAVFQRDIGTTMGLYEKYWEKLRDG